MSEIEVRQARGGDEENLLSFIKAVYPRSDRKGDENFWRWYFTRNPNHDSTDPAVLIALDSGRIVGQAGLLPVTLKTPGGTTPAAWLVDYITDPQYRRRGLGTRMARALTDRYPVRLAVPNEQSRAVLQRLGWVEAARLNRYRRVLYPGAGVKELAGWRRLSRAIDLVSAPLRPRVTALRPREGYSVRAVDTIGPEFDALWEAAQRQWPLSVVRSSSYLQWQFRAQPDKRFEVMGVYRQDTLVGYAVLYFRRRWSIDSPPAKAAITDLCYRTDLAPDAPSELVKVSLARAVARGAGSLVTDVADPPMEKALSEHGFFKAKYGLGVIASAEGELVEHYLEHGEFPKRSMAVTFDDGWRDNYLNAFPVLQELGIRATVFLVAGEVGKTSLCAVTKGEPARAYLTRDQILEMDRHGIEFGSHTLSHQLLDRIPEHEALSEIAGAKERIEGMLGKKCRTFAYPAGFFTPAVQVIVREAGHVGAFSTVYGPDDEIDSMALNRVEILRKHRLSFQLRRRIRRLLR